MNHPIIRLALVLVVSLLFFAFLLYIAGEVSSFQGILRGL